MQTSKRLIAATILCAGAAALGIEQTNFARSTFDLSEWTREAHTKPLNGTEGGLVVILNGTHPQTGGCLEYRWFTQVPSTIFGIAFLDEATWDPANDGPINTVSLGMSALQLDPYVETIQQARFYLEQGGRYYEYDFEWASTNPVEHFALHDAAEEQFFEIFFNTDEPRNPNSNPDFSANGEPIRFGFGQALSLVDGLVNTNIKTGIDNFSLQIAHDLPVESICPADFNNDGFINLQDLNLLLAHFGESVPPETDGDVDGDGEVNLLDLNRLLAVFDTKCE
ncbi:MAG: hypothetical protein NXI14_00370 [bacterium]|nr:hypothetical protein [bacterium]